MVPRNPINPAWFAAVMGTGGVASVAALNPAHTAAMAGPSRVFGICLLFAAAGFFVGLLVISLGRRLPSRSDFTSSVTGPAYAAFPGAMLILAAATAALFPRILTDPVGWAVIAAWTAVGGSIAVLFTIVLFVSAFEHDDFRAEDISGIWFVPETAVLLAAFVTGNLASTGAPPGSVRTLAMIALILTGAGSVLFAFTAAIFMNRLVLLAQAHTRGAAAMWIMISPLSVTALALHSVADDVGFLSSAGVAGIQPVADTMAALLWGFSLWWIAAAALITWHTRATAFTYTPADWGFVFPPAALTIATLVLARDWESGLMSGLGLAFSLALLLIWLAVALSSARARWAP